MVKASDPRHFYGFRIRCSAAFDRSASRRIPKTSVDAILVLVRSVLPEQSTQMNHVECHDVIKQFAAR